MKYGFFMIALVFIFRAIPVSAFELKNAEYDKRGLRIELEVVPSQAQQNVDRHVQNLAAAAQKNATPEERARKDDAAKEQQPKVLNPIALLRW